MERINDCGEEGKQARKVLDDILKWGYSRSTYSYKNASLHLQNCVCCHRIIRETRVREGYEGSCDDPIQEDFEYIRLQRQGFFLASRIPGIYRDRQPLLPKVQLIYTDIIQ